MSAAAPEHERLARPERRTLPPAAEATYAHLKEQK
jgi:hypothetical protein